MTTMRDLRHASIATWANRWMVPVCALLCLFVASQLVLEVAAIPEYYRRVVSATIPPKPDYASFAYPTNELFAEAARWRGMSLQGYALYGIALTLLQAAVSVAVAVLLMVRANRNWFPWFTALLLLLFPSGYMYLFTQVAEFATDYVVLGSVLWTGLTLWLFLFPNGRAVPRWALWLMLPLITLHFLIQAVNLLGELGASVGGLFALVEPLQSVTDVAIIVALLSQIYRYIRVSTAVERQQTKWFLVGFALWVLPGILLDFAPIARSPSGDRGILGDIVNQLAWIFVPLAIGVSILRYRLFDIDVIIRRTLLYAVLTALLAGAYFGLITVLQQGLVALTGRSDLQLATVASTLVVAGAFLPLRNRVQAFIDRRFYRRKYDAEQAAARFAAEMRDAVSMDEVTAKLFDAVDDTIQPHKVMLWLPQGDSNDMPVHAAITVDR